VRLAEITSTPSSTARRRSAWDRLYHNGLDVDTDAEVDEAWRLCNEQASKWGCTRSASPRRATALTAFCFWDGDDNAWEILSNPKGGYTWIFEQGDLEGRGHFERGFRHKAPRRRQG